MKTKILSNEEYNGLPLSLTEVIKNHVNKEENKWFSAEPTELPKYEKSQRENKSAGLYNFIKSNVYELRP